MGFSYLSRCQICRFATALSVDRTPLHRNIRQIQVLSSESLDEFRSCAFNPRVPAILPRGSFSHLPAIVNWIETLTEPHVFRQTYLDQFGITSLPTEFTVVPSQPGSSPEFKRIEAPLSWFLAWASLIAQENQTQTQLGPRMSIAQAPLSSLPKQLQADVPIPELVKQAGKGDIYADSIWLGMAPTATPLHRDPNPNLLVQVAGNKLLRLMQPKDGQKFWDKVGANASRGWDSRGRIRGEEMMVGMERDVSEDFVWGDGAFGGFSTVKNEALDIWEGEIGPGDAIFIPKAWWHAVRGVGKGAVASVNWWFR